MILELTLKVDYPNIGHGATFLRGSAQGVDTQTTPMCKGPCVVH